jgi:hypothetical protein
MASKRAYKVVVCHNLVAAVESVEVAPETEVAEDNLVVTLKLAENFRRNGNIDGEYLFAGINKAKDFALVALDFVKKLAEKSEQGLAQHNFFGEPTWTNPSLAAKQKMQH